MSLTHKLVTLNSNTATLLTDPPSEQDFYERDLTISIQNLDSERFIFVGDSTVTTANYGYRINPGDYIAFQNLSPNDEVYAVSDSGTPKVAIIKVI